MQKLDMPQSGGIHELFRNQVKLTPNAVAITSDERQYTYAELDDVTDSLASHLLTEGVKPQRIIACWLHSSFNTVIAVLGVLKAGGAYLLLDPNLPGERLRYMIKDADPFLILTDKHITGRIFDKRKVIHMGLALNKEGKPLDVSVAGDDLAYVAYTSGSTGWPKGVLITHGAVVNHALAFRSMFKLDTKDRLPLLAPLAFDMATEEMIPPLVSGCRLIDAPLASPSMELFHASVVEYKFTILNIPAPLWHQWTTYMLERDLELPRELRLTIVGSDKIYTSQFKAWQSLRGAERVQWVAAYGVTEATITSTCYMTAAEDDLSDGSLMPIGIPIDGVTAQVLRTDGKHADINEVGELYIGGKGLARGYQNLPEKTAENFIMDISSRGRLYATGDLVKRRADGVMVWIGRKDSQIKINGLRIEPAEIEAAIHDYPHANEAVVIFAPSSKGATETLCAYVEPAAGHTLDADVLRDFLKKRLHPHMMPHEIISLSSIPLNANGKIDRKLLATLYMEDQSI